MRGERLEAGIESQSGSAQVDLEQLSSGVYFVNILSSDGVLRSEKIVKY
jgi:hypothetical protein